MTITSTESNSILAKLLATENITVQHQSGIKTAMFDLKNRVLMLPVWQEISTDLEHLLIGHETAHAIDTPGAEEYRNTYENIAKRVFGDELDASLTKTVAGFLNVIEDARIDKRQKRRYPGLRKNFLLGYKELLDRNFFGTNGRDINGMNFIDRLNIYFKGGNVNLNIEFTPEEKSLLKRVENAETFAEVAELTEEIYRFCKGQIENQPDDIQISSGKSGDGEDGDEFDTDTPYDANSWDDECEDDSEDSDGEDGEGKSQGTGEGDIAPTGSGSASRGAGSNGVVNGKAPESVTDSVWEQKREELVRDANTDYIYLSLPQIDYSHCIQGYKAVLNDWRNQIKNGNRGWGNTLDTDRFAEFRRQFMEWRSKEKDTISFLVKEFEQRKSAELYSRISIAKTGMIDTNKLHSYKYNDDIFRRLSIIPEGKNHGFVMFLDWSGSMQFGLKNTMKQLFTLVLFCKQIQVPFEVYAFKDCNLNADPFSYNGQNILHLNTVGLRQFLSSKMNTAELNEAMSVMWAMGQGANLYCEGMGGTPLNEALILAPKVINDFRAKYKLEIVNTIVLTDGEANSFNGVYNQTYPSFNASRRKRVYLYTDKVTGKTHEIYPHSQHDGNNTNVFLRILKEHTGCNLIGFFLYTESWNKFMYRFMSRDTSEHKTKAQKFWKDNKFYPVKSAGYDEYYVIDSNALKEEDVNLDIDNSKSTKIMAKAFSKFAAKKTVNRVLLRNFIDHVTGQPKKVA